MGWLYSMWSWLGSWGPGTKMAAVMSWEVRLVPAASLSASAVLRVTPPHLRPHCSIVWAGYSFQEHRDGSGARWKLRRPKLLKAGACIGHFHYILLIKARDRGPALILGRWPAQPNGRIVGGCFGRSQSCRSLNTTTPWTVILLHLMSFFFFFFS